MSVREISGDATRAGDWALVRLRLHGDRILAADADGLERSLVGLTLLEAAAVRGAPLAVEALASALGQERVAEPRAGRGAVAMSGGVERAVALLRATAEAHGATPRPQHAALPPHVLARIAFPLGGQTKEETRAEAARANLAAARRRESEEACFLAGDDSRRFLERQRLPADQGEIRDQQGRALGRHHGYW